MKTEGARHLGRVHAGRGIPYGNSGTGYGNTYCLVLTADEPTSVDRVGEDR